MLGQLRSRDGGVSGGEGSLMLTVPTSSGCQLPRI